jgi:hypothetical protein
VGTLTQHLWQDLGEWNNLQVDHPIDRGRWAKSVHEPEFQERGPASKNRVPRNVILSLRLDRAEVEKIIEKKAFTFILGWFAGDLKVLVGKELVYLARKADRKPH